MIWTACIDEGGAHDGPIMLMAGYIANTEQWDAFNQEWQRFLAAFGVQFSHGKDLEKGKKQFRGWPRERRKSFILEADRIVRAHLERGFTAVLRANDYGDIYANAPNPNTFRKDTKYGVLFRGCLSLIMSLVASEPEIARNSTVNFILERGHCNSADAERLFELAKKDLYPEWSHLLGSISFGEKAVYGLQAADLLVYYSNILERKDHADQPTEIESSPYVGLPPKPSSRLVYHRMPITKRSLNSLASDFLLPLDQSVNIQGR
jgi:hypothetical protein